MMFTTPLRPDQIGVRSDPARACISLDVQQSFVAPIKAISSGST